MKPEPKPWAGIAVILVIAILFLGALFLMTQHHNRGGLTRQQPTPQATNP